MQKKIAISGASGFVGQALAKKLSEAGHIIYGLSRTKQTSNPHISEWRSCDLFSLLDAEKGLRDAEIAIYLVHSMLPSAKLVQGGFQDLDLIAADNFARAAEKNGVKQIIYLSGVLPKKESPLDLSAHLASRYEVEKALSSRGVPVTTLRAGLIIGKDGSSFRMMCNLVNRLPIMICPHWTKQKSNPVFIKDVVEMIYLMVGQSDYFGKSLDIGGSSTLTYREMLELTSQVMRKKRWFIPLPFFSAKLSKLWVSLITGAPLNLVSPLVESLKHSMIVEESSLQLMEKLMGRAPHTFLESMQRAFKDLNPTRPFRKIKKPRAFLYLKSKKGENRVRSVQRLPLPFQKDALWVANEYMRWLEKNFRGLLKVDVSKRGNCRFTFKYIPKRSLLILKLSESRSSPDRQLFYIRGGLLAIHRGRERLEFRETHDKKYILAAIHEFYPRLPWRIYQWTQAPLHVWVMRSFGKHLRKTKLPF